jgi:hypothetical protein
MGTADQQDYGNAYGNGAEEELGVVASVFIAIAGGAGLAIVGYGFVLLVFSL